MQTHLFGRAKQPPREAELNQRLSARNGEAAAHMPQGSGEFVESVDGVREIDRVPSFRCQVSGLWQYWHRNRHPDIKTVIRMPGPSTVEPVS